MTDLRLYSLVRLFEDASTELIQHIQELPEPDRYLRFGYSASDKNITDYVNRTINTVNTKTDGNYWFGVQDDGKLIASLHVAVFDSVCEFAFTTHADYRGQKIGQLLFARGYQLASEFGITRIYLNCLSVNSAMKHIASKFGLSVMSMGQDTEASVTIQYPVPLSRINEVKMSIIDKKILEAC